MAPYSLSRPQSACVSASFQTQTHGDIAEELYTRHVRGARKRIPGSDPKYLNSGSVRIIDPTLTVCRQIHWNHRSAFEIRQEIHSDPISKTPHCAGIHRDPISDKELTCLLFLRDYQINSIFSFKYKSNMHCHTTLLISLSRNSVVEA